MVKYNKIYSGGIPELKEDYIFRTYIPLITPQDINENLIIKYCKEPKSMKEIIL